MKVKIESTLAKIAEDVFKAPNCEAAKAIIYEHLKDSTIKDRDKILTDVSKISNFIKLQTYFANSLLKYEGLSVNNKKEN